MLEAFGLSDSGCVRPNNEDCYLIAPEKGLYVVADGMGGAQAGERASKLAVDTLAGFIAKSGQADAEMLAQAFQEANNQVMDAASNDVNLEGMGTTLVAALEAGPDSGLPGEGLLLLRWEATNARSAFQMPSRHRLYRLRRNR